MARFKLTLTTDQGVVLEQWTLSDDRRYDELPGKDAPDFFVPFYGLGPASLADEINDEIAHYKEAR